MKDTSKEDDGDTSFSDVLMLSEDVLSSGDVGVDSFNFGLTGQDCPRMLWFGEGNQNDAESLFLEPSRDYTVDDKSSRSNKKRTGAGGEHDRVYDPTPGKKCKPDQKKSSVRNASKVRNEKLGERIAALQQLVSPYGKTDTASVLQETLGYIKFLQDQVQVLSSPYFIQHSLDDEDTGKVKELKSIGLCLVPLSWTVHVANTNGADLWSPTLLSPSVKK